MSRLAKHLVPIDTGRRFAEVPSMSTLNVQEGVCEVPHKIAREYRLEVRLTGKLYQQMFEEGL